MATKTDNKKPYTGRDMAMVAIINGATKSGAHKNQKKYDRKNKDWKKEA